jgi:hypothetical protein
MTWFQNSHPLPAKGIAGGDERLSAPRLSSRNAASRSAVARVTRGILKGPQLTRLVRKRRCEVGVGASSRTKNKEVAANRDAKVEWMPGGDRRRIKKRGVAGGRGRGRRGAKLKANPGVDTASWKWRVPSGLIKPKEARTAHQAEYGRNCQDL